MSLFQQYTVAKHILAPIAIRCQANMLRGGIKHETEPERFL
jgi:hypothetical protein